MKTTKGISKTNVNKTIPLMDQTSKYKPTTIPKADSRKTKADTKSPRNAILTHDMIAQRAWILWDKDGCIPGRDEQNWLEAERQLKSELDIS